MIEGTWPVEPNQTLLLSEPDPTLVIEGSHLETAQRASYYRKSATFMCQVARWKPLTETAVSLGETSNASGVYVYLEPRNPRIYSSVPSLAP